ncbi:hypothetical protein [Mesorhizobium sp. M4B.F.Ca.ET.017.02.2.1]|uniref:hypothetical protein n=1 Tax=Mesorhizobium sp. M4B.F.Ca.ET.017.02.2.1 TaxID=2496649 RepID=UPI000FCBBD10|nr:hypothetical protein [Mesorhizobium sp. M4B.F.Ca.ET.017.02.2.1]RVD20425.1 hypothetical protein EN738_22685 [Mesorhizobium sp. M4B.F.Ca.ET.017.02.2.1]
MIKVILFFYAAITMAACYSVRQAHCAEAWRKFPRQAQLLDENYVGNYLKNSIRYDYYIIRDQVHIDDIVETNGGNILIVANDLFLNAPIDTRVHFQATQNYWQKASGASKTASFLTSGYYTDVNGSPGIRPFDAWYYHRLAYDPRSKKYALQQIPSPSVRTDNLSETFEYLELPSAQIPPLSTIEYGDAYDTTRASDGVDAPDQRVIFENARSGDITIFAGRIHLCETCDASIKQTLGQPGGAGPFLQVSGLQGGLGSPGTLPYTIVYPSKSQTLNGARGGLSGRPGKGGDAGAITIHLTGKPAADEAKILKMLSDYGPGEPALPSRMRTLSFNEARALQPAHYVQYFLPEEELPAQELARLAGKAGTFQLDTLTSNEALSTLVSELRAADAIPNYSLKLLLQTTRSDPSLFSTLPSDGLLVLLSDELSNLQSKLIGSLPDLLSGANLVQIDRGALFSSLDCTNEMLGSFTGLVADYLHSVCQFAPVPDMTVLKSYFFRLGGLISVVPSDVNVDLRHRETVDELSSISQLIAASIDEQMQENAMVFQYISAEKRANFVSKIVELEKKLKDIENVARKDDDMLEVITRVGETGQHLGKAVAAIEAEQWAVAIPELRDGLKGLASLLTYGYLITPFVDDSGVRAALADAQQALRGFDKEVSKIVEESISIRSNNLEKLVSSRRQQWIRRAQKSFAFGDLLRAIVLDYLQRPNEPLAAVKENVGVVERSLNRQDPAAGTLHIQSWRDACLVQAPVELSKPSGTMGCVLVHALAETPSAVVSNEERLGRFPLLVLDRGRAAYAVSFGYVFDRMDVEQIRLGSNPIPAPPR